MRLAALTGSLSRLAGGTFTSIRRPLQEMAGQFRTEVAVFGLEDQFTAADVRRWLPLHPEAFRIRGPRAFGWAPAMGPAVSQFRPDLIQVHGIWMHFSLLSLEMHRRSGTPYVLHPHGTLDPWAIGSSWKKRVVSWLFQDEQLRSAACLRALCDAEVDAVRKCGYEGPICRIPNGIDLPPEAQGGAAPWRGLVEPGKKVLLSLGRIHEKKGLPSLIHAWSRLLEADGPGRDWTLVLAGWDTTDHLPYLRRMVADLRLADHVKLVGPYFDEAKDHALRSASAFILPSLSEGLPVAVLEAWAYSLPVIMTPHCNLPEGFAAEAAIRVEAETTSIENGLRALMGMADAERAAMGARGRHLVGERFRWEAVAREIHAVNTWILGGGGAPGCVL